MFKKYRTIVLALALGILLSFSTVAMAAGYDYISKSIGTVSGYTYNGGALIDANSQVSSSANVECRNGSAPAYYMGASTYLYKSSGVMVDYSQWSYNTSSSTQVWSSDTLYNTTGSYYAKSVLRMYNGSGYTGGYVGPTTTVSF